MQIENDVCKNYVRYLHCFQEDISEKNVNESSKTLI